MPTYWASQIDLLAERHHVVALDLGGHGQRGFGRGDWSPPAFGDDVIVVEDVGANDVALVGHSMGCGLAHEFARPEGLAGPTVSRAQQRCRTRAP